jgi:hypothetical protein
MFYLQYIDRIKQAESALSQWGTLNHLIHQEFYEGKLDIYELTNEYAKLYSSYVTEEFPPNAYVDLSNTYYQAGLDYWNNFVDRYEYKKIIGIEEKVNTNICDGLRVRPKTGLSVSL